MATTVGSDLTSAKTMVEQATPPALPDVGQQKLYIDSTDHLWKAIDHAGNITTIGAAVPAVKVFMYQNFI